MRPVCTARGITAMTLLLLAASCAPDTTSPETPGPDRSSGLPGPRDNVLGTFGARSVSPFEPGSSIGPGFSGEPGLAGALQALITNCTFTTAGTTMKLDADCTTDATIFIPDGFTLDGRKHTITAVDPVGGHFVGAVVQNAGAVANVKNLGVTASNLANVCDAGALRLRGIMLEGASGTIEKNTVTGINQGASGCQEGNAIEVRNAPFDGTHPNTMTVVIRRNTVDDYQKTGIVTNGDVNAMIEKNDVGGSATQANLAANGIQVGFGAIARVAHNDVAGNSWCCADAAATAILVFAATGVDVSHNDLGGNADVGIYFDESSGGGAIQHNKVYESGPDGFYDVGIGDYGVGNDNRKNDVCGYDIPYEGNLGADNEVCGEDGDEDDDRHGERHT